jgi:hypothetical protein
LSLAAAEPGWRLCCAWPDWLWTEAAADAIAAIESPHEASALALSPTSRIAQAASLTRFRVWVDFIIVISLRDLAANSREAPILRDCGAGGNALGINLR